MGTGAACQTYNILLGEQRLVGAVLIADAVTAWAGMAWRKKAPAGGGASGRKIERDFRRPLSQTTDPERESSKPPPGLFG